MTTCECGCGQATDGQPRGQRFVKGHNSRLQHPGYEIDPQTGCWNWKGYVNPKTGYAGAATSPSGRFVLAYRAYYERVKGPVPSGKQLDHVCRNRACVNPDHLEAVTISENIRRSPRAKLHLNGRWPLIKEALAGGATQTDLADRFGVTQSAISHALRRERHV